MILEFDISSYSREGSIFSPNMSISLSMVRPLSSIMAIALSTPNSIWSAVCSLSIALLDALKMFLLRRTRWEGRELSVFAIPIIILCFSSVVGSVISSSWIQYSTNSSNKYGWAVAIRIAMRRHALSGKRSIIFAQFGKIGLPSSNNCISSLSTTSPPAVSRILNILTVFSAPRSSNSRLTLSTTLSSPASSPEPT